MPAVPRFCTRNKTARMTTAMGMMKSSRAVVASFTPSTALSTEMAGVMSPSP